jgi:hypothetical protein
MSAYSLEVSQHIIAYVDILGYEKAIIADEAKFRKKLQIAMLSFHSNFHTIQHSNLTFIALSAIELEEYYILPTGVFGYKIFSDNFIIYCKLEDNVDFIMALAGMIDSCHNIQCHFSRIGLKIRGAITAGDLAVNKDLIYGLGLVKAVNIETHVARYPRIVLDKEFIEKVSDELLENLHISIDEDGEHF